jgi:methionine-gamma-lyase
MSEKTFPLAGFSSVAIHGNESKHPNYAHVTPIYATSTFTFDTAQQGMQRFEGKEEGYIYSRWGNPTFTDAEKVIAAMEAFGLTDDDGSPLQLKAILHASGQAAMTTMFLANLKAGDKILSHYSLYGGTHELITKVFPEAGIEAVIADLGKVDTIEETINNNPHIKLVHIETPANPTLACVDIEAVVRIAKQYGCMVTVDNTFATPYLQQPFKYGVDFVFHSTTKFLNGHGTAIGGVLIGKDIALMNGRVTKWQRLLGGNSNPFDAFLLLQGLKTLEIRMDRHCRNAMAVAEYLDHHPSVLKVNYTGLSSHPDYEVVQKQMKQPGALLSFELKGGLEAGKQFIDKLQMCVRAVSLGTADTLLCHPATMTHYGVAKEEREKFGITDGLIRMSVGIEGIADIIDDLKQALTT